MKKTNKIETKLNEQLLNNFFTIDGKVATLKLVYDTFEELINPNFGDEHIEKLNDKLFSDIKEAIDMLPTTYKLNVEVVIKDFGEYSHEECENIILQNIKLSAYMAAKFDVRHLRTGFALIGIGAAVLIASYFLHSANVKYDVLFDIVNISGTLCVWEGANTAFLERNIERKAIRKIVKIINSIKVVQCK